jgi:hypothetical protein
VRDDFDAGNDMFDEKMKKRARSEEFALPEDYAGRVFGACAALEDKKVNAKGKRAYKWIIGVAAALAIFVAVPNVSMPAAQAMERVPLLGQIVKVVTFRDYQEDTAHTHADVQTPQIQGGGAAAKEANADVDKYTNELVEQFKKDCESIGQGYEGLDVKYTVTSDTDGWFTLRVDATQTMASGYDFSRIYNIDKTTDKVVRLGDLFKDGSGWQKVIDAEILRQMKDNTAKDSEKVYFPEDFKGVAADRNYYFDGDGNLVIVFDEYEVAPGSMGEVEFTIDKSVYAGLLK